MTKLSCLYLEVTLEGQHEVYFLISFTSLMSHH